MRIDLFKVSNVYRAIGRVNTEIHGESIKSKCLRIDNILTSMRICDLADHIVRKSMRISFCILQRATLLTLACWQLHAARRLGLS